MRNRYTTGCAPAGLRFRSPPGSSMLALSRCAAASPDPLRIDVLRACASSHACAAAVPTGSSVRLRSTEPASRSRVSAGTAAVPLARSFSALRVARRHRRARAALPAPRNGRLVAAGALVLHTPPDWVGAEIEISPTHHPGEVHRGVRCAKVWEKSMVRSVAWRTRRCPSREDTMTGAGAPSGGDR